MEISTEFRQAVFSSYFVTILKTEVVGIQQLEANIRLTILRNITH